MKMMLANNFPDLLANWSLASATARRQKKKKHKKREQIEDVVRHSILMIIIGQFGNVGAVFLCDKRQIRKTK